MNESQRHVEVATVIKASLDSNEAKYKAMVNERDDLKAKLTAAIERERVLREALEYVRDAPLTQEDFWEKATEMINKALAATGKEREK